MPLPSLRQVEMTLVDVDWVNVSTQQIKISAMEIGILIYASGYGCANPALNNSLLCIQQRNGQLIVLIYGDIQCEKPTHIIPLGGARVSNRSPE